MAKRGGLRGLSEAKGADVRRGWPGREMRWVGHGQTAIRELGLPMRFVSREKM